MNRYTRVAVAFIAGGGLTLGALAATAGTAFADYGSSSAYQVEISANTNHPSEGSFWMWTELTPAAPGASYGTGDYQETDCIHQGAGGVNGAAHDSGTLSWSIANGVLTLTNVKIIAGAETATMSLPTTSAPGGYGHTNGMTLVVTAPNPAPPGLPPAGVPLSFPSQNQIAP
jgi:CubicO group peptidase (beta-lactamase class C family)